MKLPRILAFVTVGTALLGVQTPQTPNSGVAVTFDASTTPAVGQVTWWGDSNYHYLLEYTLEMGEMWTLVPYANPHGENGVLESTFTLSSGNRIFFRALRFGPDTLSQFPDTDTDGLPDAWEIYHFGNLTAQAAADDFDFDGLDNLAECQQGTNPNSFDTDGDGLSDGDEVLIWSTSPVLDDSDHDGMNDGWEVANGLDPNDDGSINPDSGASGDPDADGLTNVEEMWNSGNPQLADTDGDGLSDGDEVHLYFTEIWDQDSDGDDLTDYEEVMIYLSSPIKWDTDEDTLSDGDEVLVHLTNVLIMDTDGDWIWDDVEIAQGLDPTDSSDGLLDADGDTIPNQIEFVFRHLGFDPFVYNNPATFLWNADPDGDSLTTLEEFTIYHTNPAQPDTDGDGMNDGWELLYGFNPLVNNQTDADPDNNLDVDPDNDGLPNRLEEQLNTNPLDADTDGDGFSDKVENESASNPTNPASTPNNPGGTPGGPATPLAPLVPVVVIFGDPSRSHSEKYCVTLEPQEGDPSGRPRYRTNRQYGVLQTDTFYLPKGSKYKVKLSWVATDPNFRGTPSPDYDYKLEFNENSNGDTAIFTDDPDLILGEDNQSNTFFADGKSATLYVAQMISQTVVSVPANRSRTKLGVGENVNVKIKPDGAPMPTWTLSGTPGTSALIDDPANAKAKFLEAGIRACTPTVQATILGGVMVLNFNVVQPDGEIGLSKTDLTITPGAQGAAMDIIVLTLPDDVCFSNVEVKEFDKGTHNITDYYTHHPTVVHDTITDWAKLNIHNKWVDSAGFFGAPPPWSSGTYDFWIEVRWRVKDKESGSGEYLADRVQAHKLVDSTGYSIIEKLTQVAERSP